MNDKQADMKESTNGAPPFSPRCYALPLCADLAEAQRTKMEAALNGGAHARR
jgi:hypothetical protein